jgi:uncharacterized damage-inducible protein DinB
MELTQYLRIQAHANRLANQRLHAAMALLSHSEFHAPRTGFFPSLAETLNHILEVDLYYGLARRRGVPLNAALAHSGRRAGRVRRHSRRWAGRIRRVYGEGHAAFGVRGST